MTDWHDDFFIIVDYVWYNQELVEIIILRENRSYG